MVKLSDPTPKILLRCENLSFSYDHYVVVDQVDFAVEEGDYLCIVGSNGAGKSTLMKGLLGLKKPSRGRIVFYEGADKRMSYLPQKQTSQRDFPALVSEVVASGCLNQLGWHPFYPKKARERCQEMLALLQIEDLARRSFRELSGGQQQRVLLARALCAASDLILLDEPVAGLDPRTTEEMYAIIEDLNRHHGVTILMVSHDMHAALAHAKHVLQLDGTQLFWGTREEYLQSPYSAMFTHRHEEGDLTQGQEAQKGGDRAVR